jgi:hypothetical protein
VIHKYVVLTLVTALCLVLVACVSTLDGVPSLGATPTAVQEAETLSDEAKVMAFVECMRDQGIDFNDPGVDAGGYVQAPELVEGVVLTRQELAEPYAACAHHLEGRSFGRERTDMTERVDQFVIVAACLRDKGYDVDDPTAETLDQWGADFRVEFDWDYPAAKEAYEECSGAG